MRLILLRHRFGGIIDEPAGPDDRAANGRALAAALGPFARAIEQEAAAQGRVLLQLTVPLGDAMYYWSATPKQAEEWRCVSLWSGSDHWRPLKFNDIGVVPLDWAQFYDVIRDWDADGSLDFAHLLDVPVNDCAILQV